MSDSESTTTAAPPHAPVGGKTLQSLERPRYKSWRKKYRKLRHHFDGALDENKRQFKEEQKLECIAKRLREELDGLLELCLELNNNAGVPPELRFNVHYPSERNPIAPNDNLTPEAANAHFANESHRARRGEIGSASLQAFRDHIDARLAAQDVETLDALVKSVPQPLPSLHDVDEEGVDPVTYLTPDQEEAYLLRLDAKSAPQVYNEFVTPTAAQEKERDALAKEGKHWAELTPRELERQTELQNPQSQHNWLKLHHKSTVIGGGDDDADSVASHDTPGGGAKTSRKRPGKDKNLAKQVGDRAVERAREGFSPSADSGVLEEDELGMLEEGAGGVKKKGRDPDGTYRVKGGKGGSGPGKAKRKRSGEDLGGGGGLKKARVEGDV